MTFAADVGRVDLSNEVVKFPRIGTAGPYGVRRQAVVKGETHIDLGGPDIQRVRRQLRCLNAAYAEADDKIEVRGLIEAKLHELETLHALLPGFLKRKSWLLAVEQHDQWTAGQDDFVKRLPALPQFDADADTTDCRLRRGRGAVDLRAPRRLLEVP